MKHFPVFAQLDQMDCGPTCVRMIAKYYGRTYSLQTLREKCFISRLGVSLLGISDAAESIGFRTSGVQITFEQLEEIALPAILYWNQNHFVVCYKVKRSKGKYKIYIADPAGGRIIIYNEQELKKCWINTVEKGSLLLTVSCGY